MRLPPAPSTSPGPGLGSEGSEASSPAHGGCSLTPPQPLFWAVAFSPQRFAPLSSPGAGRWHEDSSQQKQALAAGPASGPQDLQGTHSWNRGWHTSKTCSSPSTPQRGPGLTSPSQSPIVLPHPAPSSQRISPTTPVALNRRPPTLTCAPGQFGKWRPGGWQWLQLGRGLWGSGPVGAERGAPRG